MKRGILLFVACLSICTIKAQILAPVKWSYAAKKISNSEALVFLKATIDAGWHIYSTKQPDGGPKRTEFEFQSSSGYKLIGKLTEPQPIIKFEKTFNMDVQYFEKTVIFQQKVTLTSSDAVVIGKVNFI